MVPEESTNPEAPITSETEGEVTSDIPGPRKAAILLVSLSQNQAAEILEDLNREQVEEISMEIAQLKDVSPEERNAVIEEFYHVVMAQQYVEEGGIDYARSLLRDALGSEEANQIIDAISQTLESSPFSFLQQAETENLLAFLQDEHPQTIALLLAYMSRSQAAEVLAGLPADKQLDCIKRLANMEHTSPEIIDRVENALERRLSDVVGEELRRSGGAETVAEILNLTDRSTERSILESIEEEDPELVEEIRNMMFVFEDIILVNDRGVQEALKEIDTDELALALRTASDELKEKFFDNLSSRAVEVTREEMEYMGPVRLSDVEAAQQRIVDIIRRLEEEGKAVIEGRGGEEELIV